jgi:hypothetical protein
VRKVVVAVAAVVVLLVLAFVVTDRVVAATAERAITDRIGQSVPGAASVETSIHGVPVLTQALRGSLDHVTVTLAGVPSASGGPTIDSAVVDLYGVSVGSPRTAQRVEVRADVSTAELQKVLGDAWRLRPDGDAFAVAWTGGLPVEARVVPGVRDGKLVLDLESVTVLGVHVDGSSVPTAVTDQIASLASSVGRLPLGLTPTSVAVTPHGVELVATGTDVDLEAA